MDFWLQAEDLPHPDNRVYYHDGKVHLDVVETNPEALKHLKRKLKDVLSEIGWPAALLERSLYLGKDIPLSGTAHQAGTCRSASCSTRRRTASRPRRACAYAAAPLTAFPASSTARPMPR